MDTEKYVKYNLNKEKLDAAELQKDTPMFLYHGVADDVLPVKNLTKTYQCLKEFYGEKGKCSYNTE